ncbi:MAG: thioesterase family protein [Planctomycetota bacterium]|nr:thioesterase family protein [Planctomycetota bacterium]
MRGSDFTPSRDADSIVPAGRIPAEGQTLLRVRYCECDPMGVAHHAAYAPWLEIGRTELLRAGGVRYAEMEQAGVFLVITKLQVQYRAPARYDDELAIMTRVAGGSRVRIDHAYEVWRHEAEGRGRVALLAEAATTLACVDASGRPRALPEWLAAGGG